MTTKENTARVGLFFLLGVALIWVTSETLSDGKAIKSRGYPLVAGFENLKELKQGDDVRMAGVKIGSVQETRLAGRRAEAVLRIDPAVQIAGDATASIGSAGLLGTNYIAIDLGSAGTPPLAAGAEIRTTASADLNTIMTQLGELGGKLDGALSSIGEVLKGKDGQPGMFQRLDTLLAENGAKVDATLTNLQQVTDKLNRGEGTLGTLIYDDQAGQDLKAIAANLKDVSDKLAKGEGTLGKLINDDSLFREAQGTLRKADRALDGMGDSGPITAVGVVAGALF
jgi:phospholipid/cholesterol/gamma-HCH transport system substrate-binding protein